MILAARLFEARVEHLFDKYGIGQITYPIYFDLSTTSRGVLKSYPNYVQF